MIPLSLKPGGAIVAYCGAPPTPGDLLHRWNLDPFLIAALLAILAAYLGLAVFGPATARVGRVRAIAFCGGWALGALALISPLCPLSVALFSARVSQHMILTAIVAPLIAYGRPDEIAARLRGGLRQPLMAALAFAGALWFWHAPGPYAATFTSDAVYWSMHLTLFGSALWLWLALFEGADEAFGGCVAAIALTTVQMGLLGAVITFAARPFYGPHLLTTQAWGLTPLQDQQLGGVVMWIPAGVVFVAGLVFAFVQAMERAESRALGRI